MKIKKLNRKEREKAYMISAYCFHMRIENGEINKEEVESDQLDDWGAFDDNGTLMAHIIDHRFSFYLDGKPVSAGGIGGVSTLPEYRNAGAIREMFKRILKDDYRNGKVISALYPFKHEFYRKAGYEVVTFMNEYSFAPSVLCDYHFDGEVCKWNNGDPADDFLRVYQTFAPAYNMALMRGEECMQYHLKADKPYIDRKFAYAFKQKGKPVSYLIFTDIRHDPAAILQVEECAWTGRDGFYAILGFLARFEADYGEIKLPLPKGIDLLRLIRSPQAYDIKKHCCQHFMVRVINVKKLLEQIAKPADCDLKIRVIDDIIEENNRTYRLKADGVTESKAKKADLELDVRALGQMAIGAVNFDEAMLRRDVTLYANEKMLRTVFTEKNIWCGDHF